MSDNIRRVKDFIHSNDAIFHYTKKETTLEHILRARQLKFSKFIDSNDPYEYRNKWFLSQYDVSFDEIEQSKMIKQFLKRKKISNDYITRKISFISFCKNLDNKLGYNHSRMWIQYGENNFGCCLVFSKSAICKTLKNHYASKVIKYDDINYDLEDVTKDAFRISLDTDWTNENYLKKLDKHLNRYCTELFFTKDSDFQDENEFRIILYDKNEEHSIYFPIGESLRAIIVGERFPKVYKNLLKELTSKFSNKIDIYVYEWRGTYGGLNTRIY